ncbi:homoserine dehydrogenase [Ignatzschineria sp. RMDPL8A]|uniref:homoserine dehydrogenase n=1 Tax=Ignatzschineria sp. RMDPL8A TaxID=2999236 RepID=UPI0024466CF8|nr:homoserine dehydrogenase [Ignatzschineria sp. RMDPL8A]MDG9730096.1 homoserine dehydrogenase [Ignatzschineria sp. RMDPL8A]
MKPFKLGILGLGTVASGVVATLNNNKKAIARRINTPIEIESVYVRSLDRDNPYNLPLTTDITTITQNPDIDIIVELMGGTTTALEAINAALDAKKHVVTANKELIALHGNELFKKAQENGVFLLFEAAVAGAIPILKTVREGLAANEIDKVAGIINGTCNYILTEMSDKNEAFETALTAAQKLGYAEADPTFDIKGIDAAHKLTILASLAFGIPLSFDKLTIEGIDSVTPRQIGYAKELGYSIKHLGIAEKTTDHVELRVHPTLVPMSHPLSHVNSVMNGVFVHGNSSGPIFSSGPGAGSLATASAVCADILDIVRARDVNHYAPMLGHQLETLDAPNFAKKEEIESAYFIVIEGLDSDHESAITELVTKHGISLDRAKVDNANNCLIMVTKNIAEIAINKLLNDVMLMDNVSNSSFIRVEEFR